MDYAALKAEIALPAYNGMTNAQIAASLNANTVQVWQAITPVSLFGVLLVSGEWGRIELTSRLAMTGTFSSPSAQDVNVAKLINFVRMVQFPGDLLPTDSATFRTAIGALLDALVTAGFISSGTRDSVTALAQRMTSRAAQLGLGTVSTGDVATAKAT